MSRVHRLQENGMTEHTHREANADGQGKVAIVTGAAEQLTLVASLRAKPGKAAELGRRLHSLYEPSRAEPGNINYDIHQAEDDPHIWMLYENWRRPADLEAHFGFQYIKDFIAGLPDVLEGEMDIRRFSMKTPFAAPKL
jgi:quinol monooxygenase YgiN